MTTIRAAACLLGLAVAATATAKPMKIDPTPDALAHAMQGRRVVLLGEVHDNAAQHALRVAALRHLVDRGARPAIAFEQFDRERQPDIDRARRERPGSADHLIAHAKGAGDWQWESYRPFVELALEYGLPIVAANLSRADAMRVALEGWNAIFDATAVRDLGLESLPADFRRRHEEAIALGHCNLLPADQLLPRARAQIARDIVMARSIRRFFDRGVVLLTGNGHVRRDIGVPFWLPAGTAHDTTAIGLLERDGESPALEAGANFDAYVVTEPADRTDSCKALADRLRHDTTR
jgi:uncharacterized iron-regulated protein